MPAETYIAKTIENAPDAIASHVRWKISLLLAARMREPLSERATRSIQHPEEDSIRKWLLSEHTLHLRGTPEYQTALDLHAAFHRQMLAIANLINAGEYEQAERLINAAEHLPERLHRAGQRHHGARTHAGWKVRDSETISCCCAKDSGFIDACGLQEPRRPPQPAPARSSASCAGIISSACTRTTPDCRDSRCAAPTGSVPARR